MNQTLSGHIRTGIQGLILAMVIWVLNLTSQNKSDLSVLQTKFDFRTAEIDKLARRDEVAPHIVNLQSEIKRLGETITVLSNGLNAERDARLRREGVLMQ